MAPIVLFFMFAAGFYLMIPKRWRGDPVAFTLRFFFIAVVAVVVFFIALLLFGG